MLRLTCRVKGQEWFLSLSIQKEVAIALVIIQVVIIATKLLS